ncbi:MAG: ABC transporter permease [Rickettsia endosymbiont of Pseudomimeciton antennatum]|nr:ABC transporter permease [Rickettsia endosymbiont of Pseudomimeciton antennatum]MCC8398250.1 ABC transporter permease [Rickettsia endosymbiont of Labidopullus appendiculatus]
MIKYFFSKKYWLSIMLLTQASISRQNKDSFLGSLWGLVQPFVHIITISFFFGFLLKLPREAMIMNLVGAIPLWTFIITSLNISANSLISRSGIIKKIIISRTIFPISDSLAQVYNLIYSFVAMYIAFIILYPERFNINIFFVPILVLPLIISVCSSSIAFAFLTPYIRDVPQMLNLILSVVYWTIPIVYPYSMVPESKRIFFEINPIFLVIRPVQFLITEGVLPDAFMIIKSVIVAVICAFFSYLGYRFFAKNVIYYI